MLRYVIRIIQFLAIPATTLTACSGGGANSTMQRTDSAGVEIAIHSGADIPLDWSFTAAFSIGGEDSDESFYEADATTIGVDGQSRIYVLDRDGNRVVVFDADGQYLRTMGGEGGGPGEMRFPITISVAPDGGVDVFDITKRGFVRFGPEGEILDERHVTVALGTGTVRHVGEVSIVPIRDLDIEDGTDRDQLIVVDGSDSTAFVTVERPVGGVVTLKSCGMQIAGIGPVFRPGIRWTPAGTTVAVATTADYNIAVYRDGQLIRILRRTVPPLTATPELAVASVGGSMQVMSTGGIRTCDAGEVVEQRGVAEVIPVIADVAEGPGGTLWVRRRGAPGDRQPTDVFDSDGTYVGSLPAGSPFPAAVLGDRLIAIEADDMDVERLVIYDVIRSTS